MSLPAQLRGEPLEGPSLVADAEVLAEREVSRRSGPPRHDRRRAGEASTELLPGMPCRWPIAFGESEPSKPTPKMSMRPATAMCHAGARATCRRRLPAFLMGTLLGPGFVPHAAVETEPKYPIVRSPAQTAGGLVKPPPRNSEAGDDASRPASSLWNMALSRPTPKMSRRPGPQEQTAGWLMNLPPSNSQSFCEGYHCCAHALCQTAWSVPSRRCPADQDPGCYARRLAKAPPSRSQPLQDAILLCPGLVPHGLVETDAENVQPLQPPQFHGRRPEKPPPINSHSACEGSHAAPRPCGGGTVGHGRRYPPSRPQVATAARRG